MFIGFGEITLIDVDLHNLGISYLLRIVSLRMKKNELADFVRILPCRILIQIRFDFHAQEFC